MALVPADFHDMFIGLSLSYVLNPNVEEELARRRLLGLPLGDAAGLAAYEARRLPITYSKTLAGAGLNVDVTQPPPFLPINKDIGVLSDPSSSAHIISCSNCWAGMRLPPASFSSESP